MIALAGAKSRTTRDATSPCSSRPKIWLMEDRGLQFDIGFNLAFSGEGQRFGHILACADEGTADSYAACHHIEERNRKLAWRQPDEDASTAPSGHAQSLLECDQRGSRNQNAMSSAAGSFLHRG